MAGGAGAAGGAPIRFDQADAGSTVDAGSLAVGMPAPVKAGSTLEEAMSREKQIFSTMFLSMIRVAEARGGVPETLRMMGNHYEARQRLIRQARSSPPDKVAVFLCVENDLPTY